MSGVGGVSDWRHTHKLVIHTQIGVRHRPWTNARFVRSGKTSMFYSTMNIFIECR